MSVVMLAVLLASSSAQLVWSENDVRRCSWTVAHGMKGLLCSAMDLREVPPLLSSTIELLDLSSNRIRLLAADSLSRYTYLHYLYMNDNLLMSVDDAAFSDLYLLEVVDLSLNALHVVPSSLLQLPALRRLYFADNVLGLTGATGLEDPPSATTELHFLSLARCGLTDLPPLQGFRKLHTLNVSGNSLSNVTVDHVAPLCRLAVLDLMGNSRLFSRPDQLCDCALLDKWLRDKGVELARDYTLQCAALAHGNYVPGEVPEQCAGAKDKERLRAEVQYEGCRDQLVAVEQTARTRKAWSTTAICVGVAVGLGLVALLAWLRCRRRRRLRPAPEHNHKPLLSPGQPAPAPAQEPKDDSADASAATVASTSS